MWCFARLASPLFELPVDSSRSINRSNRQSTLLSVLRYHNNKTPALFPGVSGKALPRSQSPPMALSMTLWMMTIWPLFHCLATGRGHVLGVMEIVQIFRERNFKDFKSFTVVSSGLGSDLALSQHWRSMRSEKDTLGSVVDLANCSQDELSAAYDEGSLYLVECSYPRDCFHDKLAHFHSTTLGALLLPDQAISGEAGDKFKLRLDSLVFTYSIDGDVVALGEAYAVKNGPKVKNVIQYWNVSSKSFTEVEPPPLWERRTDLQGAHIKAGHVPLWPLVNDDNGTLSGMLVEVFYDIIAKRSNFTMTSTLSGDGLFGGISPDGTVNGLVGMLASAEVDISLLPLAMTASRVTLLDFSFVLFHDKLTLMTKSSHRHRTRLFEAYVDIFEGSTWLVVLVFIALLAGALTCVARCTTLRQDVGHGHDGATILSTSLSWILLLILQKDTPFNEPAVSTRAAFFTANIFGLFVFSCYTALLTSTMMYQTQEVKIHDFEELLEHRDELTLGIWTDTYPYELLKNAAKDSPTGRVFRKMVQQDPEALFNSKAEAMEKFQRLDDKFVTYDFVSSFFMETGNSEVTIQDDFKEEKIVPMALPLAPRSEFTDFFKNQFLTLYGSGVIARLMAKWKVNNDFIKLKRSSYVQGLVKSCRPGTTTMASSSLGFQNVGFPFLTLAVGLALAICLALMEATKTFLSSRGRHDTPVQR